MLSIQQKRSLAVSAPHRDEPEHGDRLSQSSQSLTELTADQTVKCTRLLFELRSFLVWHW